MNSKNEIINERVENMVDVLHISHYHRHLLTCMISKRLLNPEKRTDQILKEVIEDSIMSDYANDRGKDFVKVSSAKELDSLEEALHGCDNLPEQDGELTRGFVVSNVVRYYAKKILDE